MKTTDLEGALLDTANLRYKAEARREWALLWVLAGEVLFFHERRTGGWPLPPTPQYPPSPAPAAPSA